MTPKEVVEQLQQDADSYEDLMTPAMEADPAGMKKLGWAGILADDEGDFLCGKTCNPDTPEECESCQ